jgi:hypothetical protein
MKWRPFQSGVPYTCQDCPAYREMFADRNRWRSAAEALAKELKKADASDEAVSNG